MYSVRLHRRINQILELFDRVGLWHHGNSATVQETVLKIFYSLYFTLLPLSLFGGAAISENSDEAIFLVDTGIVITVMVTNLTYIIWNKDEIIELLQQTCVYPVGDQGTYTNVTKNLDRVMKFATVFWVFTTINGVLSVSVIPLAGNERKPFFNIAFPLDWKENEIGFWMAYVFLLTEAFLAITAILFSPIKWYVMLNCSMKYVVLGNQLRNMGAVQECDAAKGQRKILRMEKNDAYARDLIAGIESYQDINQLTNNMASFLSFSFAVQLTTSALCICGCVYSLAFNVSDNSVDSVIYSGCLFYNIFDIYFIMFLGNEITETSDGLSYCLFESDWVDQPQPTQKMVIIFSEQLKQPQQLVILKLYPMTLETFTRILNSAYSMFNILKSFK